MPPTGHAARARSPQTSCSGAQRALRAPWGESVLAAMTFQRAICGVAAPLGHLQRRRFSALICGHSVLAKTGPRAAGVGRERAARRARGVGWGAPLGRCARVVGRGCIIPSEGDVRGHSRNRAAVCARGSEHLFFTPSSLLTAESIEGDHTQLSPRRGGY